MFPFPCTIFNHLRSAIIVMSSQISLRQQEQTCGSTVSFCMEVTGHSSSLLFFFMLPRVLFKFFTWKFSKLKCWNYLLKKQTNKHPWCFLVPNDDFSSVFTSTVKLDVIVTTTKATFLENSRVLIFKSRMRLGTQYISELVAFYSLKINIITHE